MILKHISHYSLMADGERTKKQLLGELKKLRKQISDLEEKNTDLKTNESKLLEEQKRFLSVIENSSDVIMVANNEGDISFITPSVKNVFGYEPEELMSKPTFDFAHPDDLQHLWNSFLKLLENPGVPHSIEFRTKHKDGYYIITEATGNNLFHVAGVDGILVNFHDITERKKAEEVIGDEREFYRSFVESMSDWVWEIDEFGVLTYSNSAILDILRYSVDEVVGKHLTALWADDERTPEKLKWLQTTLKSGKGWRNFQGRFKHRNGSIRDFESAAIPIFDKNDNLIGYRGVDRDITTRKHSEDEMKKRLMKFKLDEGSLYLVKEETPVLSMEVVNDFMSIGNNGLVISRTPVTEISERITGDVEFVWLSEKKGKLTIRPNLKRIVTKIEKASNRKVIYLERFEYLLSMHGFKKTLAFFQRLKELSIILNNVIIVSIDPETLSEQELKQLEKESKEIEPQLKPGLPEDMFEILKFIYDQNTMGSKPTYTEIGAEYRLSKPTVRKRVRNLVIKGFIKESTKGRSKVLEATEKGKGFFLY